MDTGDWTGEKTGVVSVQFMQDRHRWRKYVYHVTDHPCGDEHLT